MTREGLVFRKCGGRNREVDISISYRLMRSIDTVISQTLYLNRYIHKRLIVSAQTSCVFLYVDVERETVDSVERLEC